MTAWYRTGTFSATNGSPTLTGALTAWSAQAKVGDEFVDVGAGVSYEIIAIGSDTSITLATNYAGTTGSGKSYAIKPFSPQRQIVSNLALDLSDLTEAVKRGFEMTSTSSVLIGTGSKTFTVQAGVPILPGASVRISSRAGIATNTNSMSGVVTSYDGTTLVVNVLTTIGSGTLSDWNINIAGAQGTTGPANTLSIGSVTTGAAGSSASASITGTAPSQTLNLTIPRGDAGVLEAAADGTVSAPSLAFASSTGTGFWRPAADTMAASASGVEQWRLSNGSMSIGTTSLGPRLWISANTSTDALRVTQSGTGNVAVFEDTANPDSTPVVIDNSGRLIVGTTASITVATLTSNLQMHGTSGGASGPVFARYSNDAAGIAFLCNKTRGTTIGAEGALSNNDIIARFDFRGSDGAGSFPSARIDGIVDGTVATGAVPGRLDFSTANTAGSMAVRMRINNAGNVSIGAVDGTNPLDINGSSIRLRTANTPASATAAGNQGEIRWDSSFIYICVATNTWRRVAHSTW